MKLPGNKNEQDIDHLKAKLKASEHNEARLKKELEE
jgi:hypothetical protein